MKNKKIFIVILLVFLLTFSTAVSSQTYPLYYTDSLGREIVIEKEVERIISLAPAVTEILYALGLEDKLIAVTSVCNYPQKVEAKAEVGRMDEPNIEKIIAFEPDLVISESVTKIEDLKRLSKLGIKNIGFKPESINDTIEMISDISYLTAAEKRGKALTSEMKREYQKLKKMVDQKLQQKQRPKVFYQIWSDPLYTAGSGTFINNLIQEAGGNNIGAQAKGQWPTYSRESLIAADPEVYIISEHSSPGSQTIAELRQKEVLRSISAFKNDRLYKVNKDLVNRPSPRIIEGYKEFIKAIFPELKKEIK